MQRFSANGLNKCIPTYGENQFVPDTRRSGTAEDDPIRNQYVRATLHRSDAEDGKEIGIKTTDIPMRRSHEGGFMGPAPSGPPDVVGVLPSDPLTSLVSIRVHLPVSISHLFLLCSATHVRFHLLTNHARLTNLICTSMPKYDI